MSDDMMRIAGRDLTGLARPFSVTPDGDGHYVMRVVDAAPFAYDAGADGLRVTGPKVNTYRVVNDVQSVAATTGYKYWTIAPPSDRTWEVVHFSFYAAGPAGATTGTHEVALRYNNVYADSIINGVTAYNKALQFIAGSWGSSVDSKMPTAASDQAASVRSIIMSAAQPLYVYYGNKTDVASVTARSFFLLVKETVGLT